MTTITVTPADVGAIVASNGVLARIGVPIMPDPNWPFDTFTLLEAAGVNPRQLFNIGSDNIGIVVGEVMSRQANLQTLGPVLSTYPIPFHSLLVSAVPRGAMIELEVR